MNHPHADEPTLARDSGPLFENPDLNYSAEDGFLRGAEIHAHSLERRVRSAHANVLVFRMPKRDLERIADNYARAVAIARAYHLAELNRRALQRDQREPAA